MQLTLMFFSSAFEADDPYRLMLQASKFADDNGFAAVWTPERHFDEFGGLFANPAITSTAIAMITQNLQIRSGSLISPLHDVVRIAEEWAMVDQLSKGRAAISFGSGWNVNDFVFFPDRYQQRRAIMFEQIETLRKIWREKTLVRTNSFGKAVEIEVFPQPLQEQILLWITSSGNIETFKDAGKIGANLLTHIALQSREALQQRISAYRQARAEVGKDPQTGIVSLMLHTFLGEDQESVKKIVQPSLREYLRSAIKLENLAAQGGGAISGGLQMQAEDLPEDMLEELLDITFERYFSTASCMGSVAHAYETLQEFAAMGVDEIACLIDFGVDRAKVLQSLEHLAILQQKFRG